MSTDNFIEETLKVSSGVVAFPMLKISHANFDDICIVGNATSVTHNGVEYIPYGFKFTMPSEGSEAASTSIVIDDSSRTLRAKVKETFQDLTVELFVITSLDLNVVELELGTYNIISIGISGKDVTLSISKPSVLDNSLSSYTLDVDNFAGLFLS